MILNLKVAEKLNKFKFQEDYENIDDYISLCSKIFTNRKTVAVRTVRPKFKYKLEEKAWEREEVRRCIEGHDGMCGKMYFYFNYCFIKNIEKGFIRPEFRQVDAAWFELIHLTEPDQKYATHGIVCVKRRRAGFSWKAAADGLHDAILNVGREIGMDSKTEVDSIELFKKCKQMYDRLPKFLRVPKDGGNTKESMYFARKIKDENGNYKFVGNLSELYCLAPTDSAYEGRMMNKWISDEAGKKQNLLTMWGYTEDCLKQDDVRKGQFICFGTSGDVDTKAKGLKEFWMKHEAYRFIRFFMAGWMGVNVDKFGNDIPDKAIKKILKERKIKEENETSDYWDFIQKYPLTPNEAFLAKEGTGVGDVRKIKEQMDHLMNHPVRPTKGKFIWKSSGLDVVFVPSAEGDSWIYEQPQEGMMYTAGVDPADHNYVSKRASDMSTYIMNIPRGVGDPPRIAFSYTCRPDRADEYYEQALMAFIYYNRAKALIENNRNGMITWFESNGHLEFLKFEPVPANNVIRKFRPKIGVNKNTNTQVDMERCINEYTNEYCHYIPEYELLEEFGDYGEKNTDRAIAFGWCVYSLADDIRMKRANQNAQSNINPKFGLRKVNGKIVRY